MESNLVPAMSMSSMPPLKRAPVAATPTTALRSELTALRHEGGDVWMPCCSRTLRSGSSWLRWNFSVFWNWNYKTVCSACLNWWNLKFTTRMAQGNKNKGVERYAHQCPPRLEVLQPFHSVNEVRVRSPQFAPVAPTEVANVSQRVQRVLYREITRTDAFPLHRSAPSALKAWRDPARSPVSGQFVFDLDIKRFFFRVGRHLQTHENVLAAKTRWKFPQVAGKSFEGFGPLEFLWFFEASCGSAIARKTAAWHPCQRENESRSSRHLFFSQRKGNLQNPFGWTRGGLFPTCRTAPWNCCFTTSFFGRSGISCMDLVSCNRMRIWRLMVFELHWCSIRSWENPLENWPCWQWCRKRRAKDWNSASMPGKRPWKANLWNSSNWRSNARSSERGWKFFWWTNMTGPWKS